MKENKRKWIRRLVGAIQGFILMLLSMSVFSKFGYAVTLFIILLIIVSIIEEAWLWKNVFPYLLFDCER